ncbi:MAG: hypothetical protein Q9174_006746 [Haloplaca sp. 1 TL-2023]
MHLTQVIYSLLTVLSLTTALEPLAIPKEEVYCYQQRAPDQPQRLNVLTLDCFTLARKLVRRMPSPKQERQWSRDPDKGFELPRTFKDKTCVFELDVLPGRAERFGWAASFADIAFASNEIVAPCVHDGLHLGGYRKVGPEGMLNLYVYGAEYEPPEPPDPRNNLTATS